WIVYVLNYFSVWLQYVVKHLLYLSNIFLICFLARVCDVLFISIRVLRFLVDSDLKFSGALFSSIFSFRFLLFNLKYLVKVSFFIIFWILRGFFVFFRFLFILTTLVSGLDIYLAITEQHLSEFSPSTLTYSLLFFVLW